MIAARLGDATSSGGTLGSLVTIPAAIVSVMPALACPACWPAYASLLGSLGLGFMIESTYLMPITIVALLIAVGMLGVKARLRRGYGPLMLGLIGASLIVVAKFALGLDPLIYAGVALLIAASVWNIWPESRTKQACGSASCCTGSELNQAEVKDA